MCLIYTLRCLTPTTYIKSIAIDEGFSVGYGDICPTENISQFGRLFIITLSLCGLGFFCGPIMDYSSSWKDRIQGRAVGPALFALVFGALLFQEVIEDINDWHTALYFCLITGTTVGYGDISPNTDIGRLSTALL